MFRFLLHIGQIFRGNLKHLLTVVRLGVIHMSHMQAISIGKKGYTIALRTGSSMRECDKIISSIEHFYGHLEIECSGKLALCSVEFKAAVKHRENEILSFCEQI